MAEAKKLHSEKCCICLETLCVSDSLTFPCGHSCIHSKCLSSTKLSSLSNEKSLYTVLLLFMTILQRQCKECQKFFKSNSRSSIMSKNWIKIIKEASKRTRKLISSNFVQDIQSTLK